VIEPSKLTVGPAFGFVLAVCALVFFAGCHTRPALTPEQEQGKQLYETGCAHCHEQNDLHLKKVPPDLHGLFDHQTLPDGEPATDAEVERVVLTGKGMMPSFAYQMTKPQLDAVIAYLHTGLKDKKHP
jgi:mono/diheme cytochrome c family protein